MANPLLVNAAELLRRPGNEKRIEVAVPPRWRPHPGVHAPPALPRVDVDPVQFQQVLINLCQNAIQASSEYVTTRASSFFASATSCWMLRCCKSRMVTSFGSNSLLSGRQR